MTEIHRPISFQVCVCVPSEFVQVMTIELLFSLQSADKKKVLTHQRTFDSEGEKTLHCTTLMYVVFFCLSVSLNRNTSSFF